MPREIWVCGEALIDLIPQDHQKIAIVGGGPANTAKALARLGFDSYFIDGISSDAFGQMIKAELVNDGGFKGGPWSIGIRHPDFANEIAKTYELFDGAIASSGTYERSAHIIDPRVGVPAVGSRAATVVGPDAGFADALATALVVDGRDSVNWLGNEEFQNYSFWAVDRNGDRAWSYARP